MKHQHVGIIVVLLAATWAANGRAQEPTDAQGPRFRSAVELQPVDVTVLDDNGSAVTDLTAADFRVFVDGVPRRVANAEWVSLTGVPGPAAKTGPAIPEGYSSNSRLTGGRLIVLAVDLPNIRYGGWRALWPNLDRFVDRLTPSDRVAVVGFGPGGVSVPFTPDRALVKATFRRLNGQRQNVSTSHEVDASAADAIEQGDVGTLDRLTQRDCAGLPIQKIPLCRAEILQEAASVSVAADYERDVAIRELLSLLNGLATVEAPKTVLLISEGIALSDTDRETQSRLSQLGALAAQARATLYTLRLDEDLVDVVRRRGPVGPPENRRTRSQGLATLAAAARGAMFNVTGAGDAIIDRIERELSGYFLLGIESDAADGDRDARSLRVEVTRPNVTVRARRLVVPRRLTNARVRSPRESAAAALGTPVTVSALPMQAITFSLQGAEPGKVQLLIHADIGTGYVAAQSVAVAYMIRDAQGRIVESQSTSGRLTPAVAGIASPLPFVAGASVPPGEYTLKLAAAEGDKVGSVEHPFRASLNSAGALTVSDLIVGGPLPIGDPTQPTVDPLARFGVVHGYVEAYGAVTDLKVIYDVAADDQTAALVTTEVAGRSVGDSRVLFSKLVPTNALPPGKYRLRATISAGAAPITTLSRAFEIPTLVARSSSTASASEAPTANRELFLPIVDSDLAPPFHIAETLEAETLRVFADRVPSGVKSRFDTGIAQLRNADYRGAETSLKEALKTDGDTTGPLAYLAVAFAAAGRDFEAASAWQTALVRGSDLPHIYRWLGEALLRAHELPRARSILEEAIGRWPRDSHFTRPLAMLYATVGKGDEALRLLERYIADGHTDAETTYRGVEWIYQAHVNGRVLISHDEDVTLARRYARQYEQANGPKQALVKEWISYLERAQR